MIKLQKVLAGLGFASRREIENWIKAERLKVNGQRAHLGIRVSETDKVELDGKPVQIKPYFTEKETRVFIYNKPLGQECSKRPTPPHESVFKRFPTGDRWILVGRLDVSTSGLLLVTDNGELANRLMHPSYDVVREYRARVDGSLDAEQLKRCLEGVVVEDYSGHFESLSALPKKAGRNQWYAATLKTGRNREVRRIFEAVGVSVNRLIRVAYGSIYLPRSVQAGQHLFLDDARVSKLMASVGL